MRTLRGLIILFLGWLGLMTASIAAAQEQVHTGRPMWQSFTTQDTGAAAITHAALLTPDGLIYAANDAGLLKFDGVRWRVIPAGSERLPLRHLVRFEDGSLLAATPNGLGVFTPESSGAFAWSNISLQDSGLKEASFVPRALLHGMITNDALILTDREVIEYSGGSLSILMENTTPRFAFQTPLGPVVDVRTGLVILENGRPRNIDAPPGWSALSPVAVLDLADNRRVLVTRRSGLFTLEVSQTAVTLSPLWTTLPAAIEAADVISATRLDDDGYLLGTARGAIVRVNTDGTTRWNINAQNGFHAGAVRAVIRTSSSSALALFDGGAAFVDTKADLRIWDTLSGLTSPPVDIIADGPVTYAATRSGLFRSLSSHRMRPVPEAGPEPISFITKFQRSSMRGHFSLLISRDRGTFDFFNGQLTEILSQQVTAVHIAKTRPARAALSTRSEIVVMDFADGAWQESGRITLPQAATVTDMTEGPDGNLFVLTSQGQVWLYAPESWLADEVDPDSPVLVKQTIPRRPDPDAAPFLTAFNDEVRAFVHGAPLIWDTRRNAFISDLDLSSWAAQTRPGTQLHWYAGSQGTGGLYISTNLGTLNLSGSDVRLLDVPRQTTMSFSKVLKLDDRSTVYVATASGLYSLYGAGEEKMPRSVTLPRLTLSGWSTDGTTFHNLDHGNWLQVTAKRVDPVTLAFGLISWPNRCGQDIVTLGLDQASDAADVTTFDSNCHVTLARETLRPGRTTLTVTAMGTEGPLSEPVTVTLDIVTPWYGQSWLSLGTALIMVIIAAFALGHRSKPAMHFAFKVASFAALFYLAHIVVLELALIPPPNSPGAFLRGSALILAAALALVSLNLALNKIWTTREVLR